MVRGTSTIFPVFTWIKEGCVACYEVTVCLNLMVLNAISLDISIFKLFRFRLYKKVLKKINYFYKGCAPPVPVPKTPKIYDFWGSMVMGLCSLPPVQARSSPPPLLRSSPKNLRFLGLLRKRGLLLAGAQPLKQSRSPLYILRINIRI